MCLEDAKYCKVKNVRYYLVSTGIISIFAARKNDDGNDNEDCMNNTFKIILVCWILALTSCSEQEPYTSCDARRDLQQARISVEQQNQQLDDATLSKAKLFFRQHAMDAELNDALLLEAQSYQARGQRDMAFDRLLQALTSIEGRGNDTLALKVYTLMEQFQLADTSNVRRAIQMERDSETSITDAQQQGRQSNLFHIIMLGVILLAIYVSYQRIQIRLQRAKITALRFELQQRNRDEQEGLTLLREHPAVSRFRNAFSERRDITADDWVSLHNAYSHLYPQLERRLKEIHTLSELEWHVCMLLRLDFSPTDIASFTSRSQAAVSTIRSRLYGKFFMIKGSASDWDKFIQSL